MCNKFSIHLNLTVSQNNCCIINCTEINTVVIGNKQNHKLAVDPKVESLKDWCRQSERDQII